MFLWPCTFYRYRQKNHNGLNFLSKISKNYHVCLFIWRICSPFCLNAINKCVWLYQFQLRPRYNVIVTTFHVIVCISASQLQGKSFVKDWKRLMWFASKMQKFRRHSKLLIGHEYNEIYSWMVRVCLGFYTYTWLINWMSKTLRFNVHD